MKNFIYMSLCFVFINSLYAKDSTKLVWPQAPDIPRIEYISSVNKAKDLGIEKGFFAKLKDFIFGEDNFSLLAPFGIHVAGDKIYTTDIFAKKVYVFDKSDNEIIWLEGSKKENFMYPVDVVSDKKGNIYVSDSVRAKIYVFKKNGDFSHIIKDKRIQRPVGIALSPDEKKLYIVDTLSSQIHVTSVDGKIHSSIGKHGKQDGEFNRPTYIDIDKDGKLYITDSMNHRVQILDSTGKYIHSFGELGEQIGNFANPRGIALDSEGNIYVNDTLFNAIQIFNQKGELLMLFGRYGFNKGEFALPIDISISKENKIYISDTNNRRFQIFKRLNISN